MAKTHRAAFAQDPKSSAVLVTDAAAGINGDTPTNTALLVAAGAEGAILAHLSAMPRATVTDTCLYLFSSKDNGATLQLIDSKLMEAHTMDPTTEIPKTVFEAYSEESPYRLEADEKLYVAIGVTLADGIIFKASTTDF